MPEPSLFSFPEARRRRRTVACLAGEYPPAHDRWREKNVRKVKLLALLALVLLAVRVVPTTLPRSSRIGGPGYGLPPADAESIPNVAVRQSCVHAPNRAAGVHDRGQAVSWAHTSVRAACVS